MIPVYLGFHLEDFQQAYWCALDFTIPTIIVPNILCHDCIGKKYEPETGDEDIIIDKFKYSHKMMYY
jgi:hypothetical protein